MIFGKFMTTCFRFFIKNITLRLTRVMEKTERKGKQWPGETQMYTEPITFLTSLGVLREWESDAYSLSARTDLYARKAKILSGKSEI